MNAMVSSSFTGLRSAFEAFSNLLGAVGQHHVAGSCRRARAPFLGVVAPLNEAAELVMMLRWYQGGRKVSSATIQRGGKMTKSTLAVPTSPEGAVNTVKIEGRDDQRTNQPARKIILNGA